MYPVAANQELRKFKAGLYENQPFAFGDAVSIWQFNSQGEQP